MLRPGFEPGISALRVIGEPPSFKSPPTHDDFWDGFKKYLLTIQSDKVADDTLRYAKRYYFVLAGEGVQEVLQQSPDIRKHVMKSMAALSKYMGCYDHWKGIKERYQLKWSQQDSFDVFQEIVNNGHGYSAMVDWVKEACRKLPDGYGRILVYTTLTGLRAKEGIDSIRLIKTEVDNYLKKDALILEHYRYPELFLRRTKKAYISIVSEDVLDIARKAGNYSYTAIRMALEERGMTTQMKYCRKIFSTYLRMNGVESELIDLLQGRIPKTVFARHYFRPDFEKDVERIRKVLVSLASTIN
ncbi:integrase [Nitrososphaera sp.]|uniref:integrase n=1 Tax=Nitrososphaera sp. TaxID=1971748 RepID=UPI00307FC270